jgi:hypothetical protein
MFVMRDLEDRDNMTSSEVSMKGNSVNGKGETNDGGVADGQNGSSSSSSGRGNNNNNNLVLFCFDSQNRVLFEILIIFVVVNFQKLKLHFTENYGMRVLDPW